MDLPTLAMVAVIFATLYSLAAGISAMIADGDVGRHSSLQWMVRRVAFQAVAILFVLIALLR